MIRRWTQRHHKLSRFVAFSGLASATVIGLAFATSWVNSSSASPDLNRDGSGQHELWTVTDDECADPDVRTAVDIALATDFEGPHNSLLATPDEVSARDRYQQSLAWESLTGDRRTFQLCLRLQQSLIAEQVQ